MDSHIKNKEDDTQGDASIEIKKFSVHYPSQLNVRGDTETTEEFSGKPPSIADTEDENSDEYYDWSTDEDLVDEEAKFEEKMGIETKRKRWGPRRVATFFLSTLVGSTILAGVVAAVPIILHFYYLRPHRSEHRQYIADNVSAWLFWAAANILVSWYLAMIVDVIPAVSNLFIFVAWGEISETVRSRVELYNAAKDRFKPVLYGASGWVSWVIIFDGIYNLYDHHDASQSRAHYTPRTYQGIQFLFFFTLVLSLEKILFHVIAFAFHRKAFSDRMEAMQHNLKVIDHLRHYRPRRHIQRPLAHRSVFSSFPTPKSATPAHERSGFNLGKRYGHTPPDLLPEEDGHTADIEDTGNVKRGKNRKSWIFSSTPTSRQNSDMSQERNVANTPADQPYDTHHLQTYPPAGPQNDSNRSARVTPLQRRDSEEEDPVVVQAAKVLKSAVLHDARNLKGKASGFTGLGWDVTSAREAKRVARSIYIAFKADHHRKYLIPSDFYPAYTKHADAEDAFKFFDEDNNGDISRAEIKTKVLKVYKERRALSRSLRDVNHALKTLDLIMILIAMIILFFISLSIFNVGIGSSLSSFYTIGIAASFIFKSSASNVFDAVMFIFVTHPFDTGDRVFVDDENLIVKKVGLFATMFSRQDGTQTYYFNSQLFTKFITNVRRSGQTFENATYQVAWRTPLEKLDQLEKCMNDWLATEENRWFEPNTAVTLQKIDYQRSLEFTMGIGHNGTWQDWGLRNARKTAFLVASHYYCRQLGIHFHESPQPVVLTDVNERPLGSGLDMHKPTASLSPDGDITSALEKEVIEPVKPVLGFLPPPDKRTALTRVRKSKYRKANVRGMAEGGD
ncbi:Mechanosensitive ion channel-domain-containing protein [Hysterangium stoloniferum]|nr:Mechanosensitive ion channel-domain-containing protein [Hysterangium stoloniferum]